MLEGSIINKERIACIVGQLFQLQFHTILSKMDRICIIRQYSVNNWQFCGSSRSTRPLFCTKTNEICQPSLLPFRRFRPAISSDRHPNWILWAKPLYQAEAGIWWGQPLVFNEAISKQVALMNNEMKPLEERSTYGKAFCNCSTMGEKTKWWKSWCSVKRLARIASDLMQVGVRLYHDQALFKEGGGGITPWHADQYYWPLETDKTITAWIPLQETPALGRWSSAPAVMGSWKGVNWRSAMREAAIQQNYG